MRSVVVFQHQEKIHVLVGLYLDEEAQTKDLQSGADCPTQKISIDQREGEEE